MDQMTSILYQLLNQNEIALYIPLAQMFKTVTDFIAAESILNHQQEVEAYRRQQLLVSAKRGT